MKSFAITFIIVIMNVFGTALLAQQAGDYVATTSGDYNTAVNWSISDGAGGYSGVATSAPTTSVNVWIPQGINMTNTAGTALAKDLTIAGTFISGSTITTTRDVTVNGNLHITLTGRFQSTSVNGGNVGTLRVGSSFSSGPCTIQIDGQLGSNSLTDVTGSGFRLFCEAGGTTTIRGSGKFNIARLQSGSGNTRNQTIVIDMDANILNTANNGKTISLENGNAGVATKTLIINDGRTVRFVENSPNALLGSQENESMLHTTGNITYDIRGTLNTGAAGGIKLTTSSQTGSSTEILTLKVGPQGKLIIGPRVVTKVAQTTQSIIYDFATGSEIEFAGTSGTAFTSPATGETQSYMTTFSNLTINNTAGTTIPYVFTVAGTLNVNQNLTGTTITLLPGAKANIAGSRTMAGNVLNLNSSAEGTPTLINNGTLNFTKSNVGQYLPVTRNWYVSSPVSNALAPSGYTYYRFNESESDWISSPVVSGNGLTAGVGYIALPNAAASTITFTTENYGSINSGEVSIPLSRTVTGFNLIGNPYPAHLTWTKSFVDGKASQIEPSIWYRTNTGGVSNKTGTWSFKTINASTGESSPIGTSSIIPPMQAFWIKAKTAGDLTLNNSLTLSHQSSNPLKAPANNNDERIRVRLQVDNGSSTDETLIYFDKNASNSYDRFDSPKFHESAAATQIFTTLNNERMVINGMQEIPVNESLKIGFSPGNASNFRIKAIQLTNTPDDLKIVLRDNITLAENDLTDINASYHFEDTTASYTRFDLIFKSKNTTTSNNTTFASDLKVYRNNQSGLTVHSTEASMANENIYIFNSLGHVVGYGKMNNGSAYISLSLMSDVYFVKVGSKVTKIIEY